MSRSFDDHNIEECSSLSFSDKRQSNRAFQIISVETEDGNEDELAQEDQSEYTNRHPD
jgi:hypothetical protein